MRLSIELPPDRDSAARCRRWLRDQLAGEDDGLRDTVVLLASEVVTNAVLHARTRVEVALESDENRVRVEVHDESELPAVRQRFSAEASMGRGLLILDSLAASWGSDLLPGGVGKMLWFTVERGAALSNRTRSGGGRDPIIRRRSALTSERPRSYVLLGTPIAMLNRSWEEHGGVLRELRLLEGDAAASLEHPSPSDVSLPARATSGQLDDDLQWIVARIADEGFIQAWRIFATVRELALAPRAAERPMIDVRLDLADESGEFAARMDEVFDRARQLYTGGSHLLTPEPGSSSVAMRKWLVDELVRQSSGETPTAWEDSEWSAQAGADSTH